MRIVRNLHELGTLARPTVVTIGNFDGVHLAHQKLLRSVVEAARAMGAEAAALTFDPHPGSVLTPERTPKLLTPLDLKARLIEQQGFDLLVVLDFTKELSKLSPADFVHQVLVQRLRVTSVHVGPNFRFGHRKAGDVQLLKELGIKEAFKVVILPILMIRGDRVSSTWIRELVSEGRVHRACRLLGRPYSISGRIVPGLGVGKKQTVPTLNLAPIEMQLPKKGVYVARTRVGNVVYDSVTNVGHKPTFGEHPLTVESFLLNFSGKIDMHEMEVQFFHRLRDEMKFPDPASLKAQIQKDAVRSLKYFRLLSALRQGPARSPAPTLGRS